MESVERVIEDLDENHQDLKLVSLYEAQVKDLGDLVNIQLEIINLQAKMMEIGKENKKTKADEEMVYVLDQLDNILGFIDQRFNDLEEEYTILFHQIDLRNQEISEYLEQVKVPEKVLLN